MEIFFMFVVGAIIFIVAIIAILKGITHRIQTPTNDLKEQITTLENRVHDLEKYKE